MSNYYPPEARAEAFTCMYCSAYAAQFWAVAVYEDGLGDYKELEELDICQCSHCIKWSYWRKSKLVYPTIAPVPLANEDMPDDCKVDYDEARNIVTQSPKSAAALLRLALQKLMAALGEKGENINADIKSLVVKGLPVQVQKALDYCRVVGNNAVHPGEINLDDTPEIAYQLFAMLNFIVQQRITQPKEVDAFYNQLPQSAREAVAKRDQPAT